MAAIQKQQEELRRRQEEAARLEAEEKARIEEEERKAEEEARRKEELKALKKQKEKEKQEELKKSGKFLTKAQKTAKAHREAKLQQMIAAGVKIGALDEDKTEAGEKKKTETKKRGGRKNDKVSNDV